MGLSPYRHRPDMGGHASRVYGPLAAELLAAAPHPVRGRRVLDAGAGTGLVSDVLRAAGARPVAVDLSLSMLRWRAAERPPAAVADLSRLPLRAGAVDDAVAAFVLNHLPERVPALPELARVVRPRGAVLATVYETVRQRDLVSVGAVIADSTYSPRTAIAVARYKQGARRRVWRPTGPPEMRPPWLKS